MGVAATLPELSEWTLPCQISDELKFISWHLAEFYYNRDLQRPYTGTCTILQEMINGFLCPFIIFLKSKTHQLNFEGRG